VLVPVHEHTLELTVPSKALTKSGSGSSGSGGKTSAPTSTRCLLCSEKLDLSRSNRNELYSCAHANCVGVAICLSCGLLHGISTQVCRGGRGFLLFI
jgi:hypothetical protein